MVHLLWLANDVANGKAEANYWLVVLVALVIRQARCLSAGYCLSAMVKQAGKKTAGRRVEINIMTLLYDNKTTRIILLNLHE